MTEAELRINRKIADLRASSGKRQVKQSSFRISCTRPDAQRPTGIGGWWYSAWSAARGPLFSAQHRAFMILQLPVIIMG
jgi:hypothetical protein